MYKFKFDNLKPSAAQATMVSPNVQMISGDTAIIAYVVLLQQVSADSTSMMTSSYAETRVWQKKKDGWRCIHVHRSGTTGGQ